MARNGCNRWKLMDMTETAGNGQKWLEMSRTAGIFFKCLTWLEMARVPRYDWIYLEMARKCWKWL